MSDEIVKAGEIPPTPVRKVGNFTVPLSGLAAKKAALAAKGMGDAAPAPNDPNKREHRIGIVFDDSASMSGAKIANAIAGVEEFLKSCGRDNTAVAVYSFHDGRKIHLNTNLPATAILVKSFQADQGTYVNTKGIQLATENNLTRIIVFSDGSTGDSPKTEEFIRLAKIKDMPIDTVYISSSGDRRYEDSARNYLKRLADETGGIFLEFQEGKANFRTAFKYLSPGFRAMLMSPDFKSKVENGGV